MADQVAARASRAKAGRDFDAVLCMIDARWFLTVRWLMPRSAVMFLLGWPARTSSVISRCDAVRLDRLLAASAFQAARWLESRDCSGT